MDYTIHVKTNDLNIALNVVEELARAFTNDEIEITSSTAE